MSGFLYLPDAARFLGRNNYLINELGIAIFYPNVRGSSGYGKRFVGLDDGPFRREDSVRDIGAYLDALSPHPSLDASRFAVTGGSYGGYMCYASAIRYGDRFRGAACTVAISNFVTFLENTEAWHLLGLDEGHGFAKKANQGLTVLDYIDVLGAHTPNCGTITEISGELRPLIAADP